MLKELNIYLHQLTHLSRANVSGMGKAPHKPILLLSILQLIRRGTIQNNRIFITAELVAAFKDNWNAWVITPHTNNFAMPFYYMKSEPFWRLVFKPEFSLTEVKPIKTFSQLQRVVAYAEIDPTLFELMADPVTSLVIEKQLLETYFGITMQHYAQTERLFTAQQIASEIVNDPPEVYQTRMEILAKTATENEVEEERFLRSYIFKREIPRLYNHTCSISGMQIATGRNIQMIDACHIVPFSVSHDDTVSNGLSLSPNLHRAFDRGLLTITENFTVHISPLVQEKPSPFSLKQFEGKKISLPEHARNYPSIENLMWHRKEKFVM